MSIDYRALRDGLTDLQRKLADVRGTARSDDGLIGATVGGRGELVELTMDPRIYRNQDASALAKSIVDTVRRAAEDVRSQVYELSKHTFKPGTRKEDADLEFGPVLNRLDRMIREPR